VQLRSIVANNTNLKVASVIVAVVLWTFAKGEQTADRRFSIPLVVRGLPGDVTPAKRLPETIDVSLRGDNRELVKMRLWEAPHAFVDLSDAVEGKTLVLTMSAANVVLPRDVEVQVAEIVYPKSISVDIDKLGERKVRVQPNVAGSLDEGYYLRADPTSEPDTVTVYGPAKAIADLQFVTTEPLSIDGRSSGVEAARLVAFSEDANLNAVPREVRIAVEVEDTEVVTLEDVPLEFVHERGLEAVTIDPTTIRVQIAGPRHLVADLTAEDIRAVVDGRGLPRGPHEVVPEITVPEGLEVLSLTPMLFAVRLD